jgi:cell division protein FtsB
MDSLFYRTARKGITLGALLKKLVRNKRALAALIVGIPLFAYLLFGSHGIVQRVKLQQQKVELESRIREAEAETKRLQAESAALDGDKKAIEKTAREKYGMVREGESVYKVAPAK